MRLLAVALSLSAIAPILPNDAPPARAQAHSGLQVSETVQFPPGKDAVSLPFQNWGEHIIIPVSVNGHPPLEMVFDTGMPTHGVLLYEGSLVDGLGLAYGPMRIQVGGAGGGQPAQARLATDTKLKVGDLEIGGSVAIVMPPTPSMSGIHDGIIGATLFQDFVVSLDHDRDIMTLTKRSAFRPPAGATEIPLKIDGRRVYVPAQLVNADGKRVPLTLILDLGATHPVSLSTSKNADIVVPAGAIRTRTGRGMSGAMSGRVGRIAGLELGGHLLSDVVATFPDTAYEDPRGLDQKNGNLGSGVLGRFNLALDFGGSRLFVTPNSRFQDPFEWDMTGLVFDMVEGGKVTVAMVLDGSPAAEAKVVPGAELIAVDGAPVRAREMLQQRQRFRQAGRELSLTLKENGKERVVKLTLRRLV